MEFDNENKSKSSLESKNKKVCKSLPSSSSKLLLLLTILELTSIVAGDHSNSAMCTSSHQRDVLSLHNSLSCTTRDVIIDLNPYVADDPDVLRIIPDKAIVLKCGGASIRRTEPCTPTLKRIKRIPVKKMMANGVEICSFVDVEEDVACELRCPIQPGI